MKPQGVCSISCARCSALTAIQTLAPMVTAPAAADSTTLKIKCPCLTCDLLADCRSTRGLRKSSDPESQRKAHSETISKPRATQVMMVILSRLLVRTTTSSISSAAVVRLQRIARAQEIHNDTDRPVADGITIRAMTDM